MQIQWLPSGKKIQKKVTRVRGNQIFLRYQQHKKRTGFLPSTALLLGLRTHLDTVSQGSNLSTGLDSVDATL